MHITHKWCRKHVTFLRWGYRSGAKEACFNQGNVRFQKKDEATAN